MANAVLYPDSLLVVQERGPAQERSPPLASRPPPPLAAVTPLAVAIPLAVATELAVALPISTTAIFTRRIHPTGAGTVTSSWKANEKMNKLDI